MAEILFGVLETVWSRRNTTVYAASGVQNIQSNWRMIWTSPHYTSRLLIYRGKYYRGDPRIAPGVIRSFTLLDLDGYNLMFAQPPERPEL